MCVCVCCVFSCLAMFFTFRLLWRNKLSATHTNVGTCINYTYATLVAAQTKASQVKFGQHSWHAERYSHTNTRTLVAVALLHFQTHAKLNPRMCLTFALFWLSGLWVFSLMSLCLFHAECTASYVNVCLCVCTRDCICVSVSLPALFSSPFIRHFFLASFTTQLSRSNSRHKTRDSTLQLLSFWHAFPFHFIHFAKKSKNK